MRFQQLALNGRIPRPGQMDDIGDGIDEIKIAGHMRAACFEDLPNKTWWITHFFKTSHKTKAVRAARGKAKRARQEHLRG